MSDSDSDTLPLPGDVEQVEEQVEEEEEEEEELDAFCERCGAAHLELINWDDGQGLVCVYCHEEHEAYEYGLQMEREEVENRIDEAIGLGLWPFSDEEKGEEDEKGEGEEKEKEQEEREDEKEEADQEEEPLEPVPKRARHGCQLQ